MIYEFNRDAVLVFAAIVFATVGLSFWLGKRAKSASGFFAAGGGIHWFVNGVAFAGDYLSAASFLGICGMIAFYGYDGFLYSIGYLAGWVVALFIIAEPLKRMGRFTFADALDSKFNSPGIKLAAAISTLAVSVFYLIPQMVGAGTLVTPLFGLPHWAGVVMVGAIVILIVVTAGMVSTTYVQFLKGGLLVIFSAVLTGLILQRGFVAEPMPKRPQTVVTKGDRKFVDGRSQGRGNGETDLRPVGTISQLPGGIGRTGPLGPLEFFDVFGRSEIVLWRSESKKTDDGSTETVYRPEPTPGRLLLLPGNNPTFKGVRSENPLDKLNFFSLMLALFCGTASLPHILIRYYTVPDRASARKSTIVGIATIGAFYVLTLYMGLGAMTSGALDVTNENMAAPLLAKSFSPWLFAVISAIAFTTVLGTVSGLIIAASGAVVHDLMGSVFKMSMSDRGKVRVARVASVVIGAVAMLLGILFGEMNVSYLVGWAFSVAASANLPALVMLLFWKRTTKQGIIAGILVGVVSSLGWILASGKTYKDVYGWSPEDALVPFDQPGIVTIPLSFAALVVVSLLTVRPNVPAGA